VDSRQPATARHVVRRLLDARLIDAGHAVDGDVTVRDVSRSNGVFVLSAGELEYVVKGPGLAAAEGLGGLEQEVGFYALISRHPELAEAAPVPRLVQQVDGLLVLERTRPGDTLDDRYRERGASSDDLLLLGRALGTWRRISSSFADLDLPARLPWVLDSLEVPRPAVIAENAGAKRLAEAVRADAALRGGLAALRECWRQDAVIHGDVRFDNALVERDPTDGRERVVLVDWELLGLGDPGWDVAGALADAVVLEAVSPLDSPPDEVAYRRANPAELARLSSAFASSFDALAEGYRAEGPAETVEDDLAAGLRLIPARILNIGFLNAAWDAASGLSSGLALAGIAAGLFAEREESTGP
jgi:Ser/Thr protein kinase RdoA (MazF antagonist)